MKTIGIVGFVTVSCAALCLLAAPLPPAAAQAGGGNVQAAAADVARGDALLTARDDAGAAAAFGQALADDPQYALAQQRLADLYSFSLPDKSIAFYRALLSPPPGQTWDASGNTPLTLGRFSVVLLQMGHGPEALAAYQRAAGLLSQTVGKAQGLDVALPDLGDGPGQAAYTPDLLEGAAHLAAGVAVPGYDEGQVRWALAKAPTSPVFQFYLGKCMYLHEGAHSQEGKSMLTVAALMGKDQGDAEVVRAADACLKLLH